MRRNSKIRVRAQLLAALTIVVSLPELARAQQAGLFPLAPIKRQRVPCDQEDPIYKTYKHQYFGYHPTCWRPFPAGWGCPSPAAPDKEKSFKEIPFGGGGAQAPEGEREEAEGMEGQPAGPMPNRPALPGRERSPFEEPDADKPAPATPRGGRAPLPTPPGDPFELDRPTAPANPQPGQAPPAAPGTASNGPELSAPTEQPGSVQGPRTSQNEDSGEPDGRDQAAPLLALPAVNVPPVTDAGVPFGTDIPPRDAAVASNADADTAPPAAGSSTRRGFLSGLFNNLGINWARR